MKVLISPLCETKETRITRVPGGYKNRWLIRKVETVTRFQAFMAGGNLYVPAAAYDDVIAQINGYGGVVRGDQP